MPACIYASWIYLVAPKSRKPKFFSLLVAQGSIVWMFQINLESGGIRAAALNVCCGTPESVLPHICVKQIRFYSPLCNNTPPLR